MNYETNVLFTGFPGKLTNAGLGWGAVVLAQGHGQAILIDTGGPAIRGTLKGLLARHGLAYSDIDLVCLTHLHWDHAYNLDYFPQAEIVLSRVEWEEAGSLSPRDIYMEDKVLPLLRCLKTRLLENDGDDIAPGLTALMLPGHTRGSMGILMDQGSHGRWLFTGDACKNRAELQSEDSGQAADPAAARQSLAKMKKMADRILPGHDGWIKVEDQGRRLRPEGGSEVTLVFGAGLTVNGGLTELNIRLD